MQPAHALPAEPDELAAHLLRLVEAAAGIASLVDAEEALNRRANETCLIIPPWVFWHCGDLT